MLRARGAAVFRLGSTLILAGLLAAPSPAWAEGDTEAPPAAPVSTASVSAAPASQVTYLECRALVGPLAPMVVTLALRPETEATAGVVVDELHLVSFSPHRLVDPFQTPPAVVAQRTPVPSAAEDDVPMVPFRRPALVDPFGPGLPDPFSAP